jgi:hypothetical protein
LARSGHPCTENDSVGAKLRADTGDRDGALACLAEGVRRRAFNIGLLLKVSPMWDPLRDDPRFDAILAEMNLAEEAGR